MARRLSRRLPARSGEDVNAPGVIEWQPLHVAALGGHRAVVEVLVEHARTSMHRSHTPIRTKDDGRWPLHFAASAGHLDVVQWLFEHGADVNAEGEGGLTPLMSASRGGHATVVAFLIEQGAAVDANRLIAVNGMRDRWAGVWPLDSHHIDA